MDALFNTVRSFVLGEFPSPPARFTCAFALLVPALLNTVLVEQLCSADGSVM